MLCILRQETNPLFSMQSIQNKINSIRLLVQAYYKYKYRRTIKKLILMGQIQVVKTWNAISYSLIPQVS